MRIRHSKLGSGYVLTVEAQSSGLVVVKHKPSYEEDPHHESQVLSYIAVLIATAKTSAKMGMIIRVPRTVIATDIRAMGHCMPGKAIVRKIKS
jgi:hypothetical protein